MRILITGAAGFIGFHVTQVLHASGHEIVGIDNLNDYYDVRLKKSRLAESKKLNNLQFIKLDLADREGVANLFERISFDVVVHLGAQAGVRFSLESPFSYVDSNLTGTLTVLEGCRNSKVGHLIYASSSSVYGANTKQPFSIDDRVDCPVSLYAATKKSNEMMCHAYAHLYGIPMTGLRFFTVYGPWGRPDMAYFKFADAIQSDRSIDIYNHGDMKRDFTYIDDVVNVIDRIVGSPAKCVNDKVPHRVYNVGHHRPEKLIDLVETLEELLNKKAQKNFLPMQPGDVLSTYADTSETYRDYGFEPKVSMKEGLSRFVDWHRVWRSEAANI